MVEEDAVLICTAVGVPPNGNAFIEMDRLEFPAGWAKRSEVDVVGGYIGKSFSSEEDPAQESGAA